MPWSLRMLLMLALAGSVFQFYVLRRTTLALANVSGMSKKVIRIGAATVALWFSLYPIVSAGSYALGTRGILNSLQGYNILPDALIVYPFWIGLIFSVQVAMIFLMLDGGQIDSLPPLQET